MSQNCFTWLLRQLVEATISHEGWIRNCVSPLWDGGDVASQVCYMYNYMYMWAISCHWQLLLISPCHLLESVCGIRNRVSPSQRQRQRSWLSGCTPETREDHRGRFAGVTYHLNLQGFTHLWQKGYTIHESCEMSNGWKFSTVKFLDM